MIVPLTDSNSKCTFYSITLITTYNTLVRKLYWRMLAHLLSFKSAYSLPWLGKDYRLPLPYPRTAIGRAHPGCPGIEKEG